MGVIPAECWPYMIFAISGRGVVVAEVSIEREPLVRCGAYVEAPDGQLPLHGCRVMEATVKLSVIPSLNPRLNAIP